MTQDEINQALSQVQQKVDARTNKYGTTPKFRFRLPADPSEMRIRLLTQYAAEVKLWGSEFILDDNTTERVEKVVKWLYNDRRCLILCGTLGNGKTTMLKALKSLLTTLASESGISFLSTCVVYKDSQVIYNDFKNNNAKPWDNQDAVLLIDDLGDESPVINDYSEKIYPLQSVLMTRYRMKSTTIIATNCTMKEIAEIYGDRVADRLKETASFLTCTAPSYRH